MAKKPRTFRGFGTRPGDIIEIKNNLDEVPDDNVNAVWTFMDPFGNNYINAGTWNVVQADAKAYFRKIAKAQGHLAELKFIYLDKMRKL